MNRRHFVETLVAACVASSLPAAPPARRPGPVTRCLLCIAAASLTSAISITRLVRVRDEAGGVGGVFNIVVETTFRVLEERRERLLRELRDTTASARTSAEVCTSAVSALARDGADLPFCLIYE